VQQSTANAAQLAERFILAEYQLWLVPERRLAIAATLVLALLGYWAVAGMFPREGRGGPDIDGQEIGQKNGHKAPNKQLSPVEHMRTLSGNDAQTFNEKLPSSQAIIIIGTPSPKGPR